MVETLGPQARRVLELGMQGASDQEIAARLGMSPSTVRTHFARLRRKYGAANRFQLAVIAATPQRGRRGAPGSGRVKAMKAPAPKAAPSEGQ